MLRFLISQNNKKLHTIVHYTSNSGIKSGTRRGWRKPQKRHQYQDLEFNIDGTPKGGQRVIFNKNRLTYPSWLKRNNPYTVYLPKGSVHQKPDLPEYKPSYYTPKKTTTLPKLEKNNKMASKTKTTTAMRGRPPGSMNKNMGKASFSRRSRPIEDYSQFEAVKQNAKLKEGLNGTQKDGSATRPSLGTDPRKVIPTSVKNAVRRFTMANNTETRVIHKTQYTTGFNPSKGVRDAARSNGTGYSVLYDSKIQAIGLNERNLLTQGAGFNSKQLHVPCSRAQLSRQAVEEILTEGYDNSTSAVSTDSQQRMNAYASVIRLKRQFMIHNTSAFFPMHFKICLARFMGNVGETGSFLTPFTEGLMNAEEMATTQAAITAGDAFIPQPQGKAPWFYMHSPITVLSGETGEQYLNVDFSLKGKGPMDSNIWRENYEMVETFEKTIPPGDFWNFSHVQNCGGGIDLNQFASDNITQANNIYNPYSYCMWFETKGTLCEGVQILDTGRNTYLGTSPTYYTYEYKSSAYYAKETEPEADNIQSGQISSTKVHRREYLSDPIRLSGSPTTAFRKEIFVLNQNITTDTSSSTPGEMYIPIVSNATIRTGQPQAGPGVG